MQTVLGWPILVGSYVVEALHVPSCTWLHSLQELAILR